MVGADNEDEDSSYVFEGLADRLKAEPVSEAQADERVHTLIMLERQKIKGPVTIVIDHSLPPETVIKREGRTLTLSADAFDAAHRHEKRAHPATTVVPERPRSTGEPYRGS